ncbi:hypothetical protein INS49_015208 [Diaporthe citri]|uniref:uncharacterized protein n=1 Tax=Diaporthe citri TaxID=83186 RepID=UPI001C810F8E|nr:uncharacterized protein INS49_015208 [Diaporthe citri]KAG6357330.1 hypothetical protein INS49_015208 [Diaporthe citri]
MASQLILPVSAPVSSHDMAQFLAMDGVGAGFVRHADIWLNIDAFVDMVWALVKAPRKDGTLMKIVYIRHTVIETELFVEQCTKRLRCKAQCGIFPDDEVRVTSMTFGQAREFLTPRTALCENIIVLMDGTYLETVDTEIGAALVNQSINPASCVKVISLYSDDWDDKKAAEAVPLFSALFREVGIQKLSVSFGQSSTAGADLEPMLVDQSGLIDAMVECINDGKHIVSFLPQEAFGACIRRVKEAPALREDAMFTGFSLGSETSTSVAVDEDFDLTPMFKSDSYLMIRLDENIVRVWSIVAAIDAEAGFTTMPIKRVGLVVHSHLLDRTGRSRFNWDAGVYTYSAIQKRVGDEYLRSQRQSCRGVRAKQVCLYNGGPGPEIGHPVDHSRDFVLQVIRSWPGKPMSQLPLNLGKRDARRLGQTLDHLAVAGIIEPHENGYVLTKTKGLELVEVLPKAVSSGLSFELAALAASARHCVKNERSMRLLIRLAVLGSRATEFLSRLDPGHVDEGTQTASWYWMEEARQHMAGPARGEMSAGRLWFALGIWDKMREDTNNFSTNMPQNDDEPGNEGGSFHRVEGVGMFHCGIAVEIYMCVLQLEDRLGLSLLAPSDPEWEEPLKVAELQEVQVQFMIAFVSDLAVWNLGAGEISLVGSGRAMALAPNSLLAHPHTAQIERRPEQGYLIIPDQIQQGKGNKLSVVAALCVPLSLLRVISHVLGESAMDWLKWP